MMLGALCVSIRQWVSWKEQMLRTLLLGRNVEYQQTRGHCSGKLTRESDFQQCTQKKKLIYSYC